MDIGLKMATTTMFDSEFKIVDKHQACYWELLSAFHKCYAQ